MNAGAGKGKANMTRYDLMRLFVRLLGLMLLVSVVFDVQLSIRILMQALDPAGIAYQVQGMFFRVVGNIVAFVPYIGVGICFLWFSGRVVDSASLAPGEAVESSDLRNMEIVLAAVLGLYLLAEGLAELCRLLIESVGHLLQGHQPSVIWGMQSIFAVQALVKLAIGSLLVLRRGGLVAVLHRVQAWVRKWRAWPDEAPLSEK
jgi:hypothetical protein